MSVKEKCTDIGQNIYKNAIIYVRQENTSFNINPYNMDNTKTIGKMKFRPEIYNEIILETQEELRSTNLDLLVNRKA